MDLSGSAMSIPDENLKLFVPLRRNLGNIEFGLALVRICLLSRDCRRDLIKDGSNITGRCIVGADHAELYLFVREGDE